MSAHVVADKTTGIINLECSFAFASVKHHQKGEIAIKISTKVVSLSDIWSF